jgi:Na+/H+ antiporter NhaC
MPDHPFGLWSLVPPVAAIVLAIATRRVVLSLLVGIASGVLILAHGNPLVALGELLETHLWNTLVDEDKLRVFAFTAMMGAMVGVINRSGGMRGLIAALTPLARGRMGGQLVAWFLGLLVFFDDYANTVLLGTTLRPLFDRLRISREKLAFVVDATAAPVAGLIPVSTWVAGEISFVQQGLDQSGHGDWNAFELFINSIPYRFYVLWMLLFVPLVALMRRDFGPMLKAERVGLAKRAPTEPTDSPHDDASPGDEEAAPNHRVPARWYNAVVPVAVTVGLIVWLLYTTGKAKAGPGASWSAIFGDADAYYSLVWGSLGGLLTAVILTLAQRLVSIRQTAEAAGVGARMMLPALVILWLASALSSMVGQDEIDGMEPAKPAQAEKASPDQAAHESPKDADESNSTSATPSVDESESGDTAPSEPPDDPFPNRAYRMYTGSYLAALVGESVPLWILPTLVFVLASAVSFATGTSWGTMGILMPLVVPLALSLLSAQSLAEPHNPILVCTVGSVLAGSIFGDHCSPISDTTVLSSQCSSCPHMAHVNTQLPYALAVAVITVFVGTIPVGLGVSVWIVIPLGVAAMVVVLWLLGRPVDSHRTHG